MALLSRALAMPQQVVAARRGAPVLALLVPSVGVRRVGPVGLGLQQHRPEVRAAGLFHKEADLPLDPTNPELIALKKEADYTEHVTAITFWVQAVLTLASTAILVTSSTLGNPAWPRVFTAGSLVLGYLSLLFPQLFMSAAKEMKTGKVVPPSYISGNLLRCMVLNIAGVFFTTTALMAALGGGFLRTLVTGVIPANVLVSIDLYSLQAATTTLLGHAVSLVKLNLLFHMVRKARYPMGGVALGSYDGISPPVK